MRKPWSWKFKKRKYFENLREKYIKNYILIIFNTSKPIRIKTKVLKLNIKVCIIQEYNRK